MLDQGVKFFFLGSVYIVTNTFNTHIDVLHIKYTVYSVPNVTDTVTSETLVNIFHIKYTVFRIPKVTGIHLGLHKYSSL